MISGDIAALERVDRRLHGGVNSICRVFPARILLRNANGCSCSRLLGALTGGEISDPLTHLPLVSPTLAAGWIHIEWRRSRKQANRSRYRLMQRNFATALHSCISLRSTIGFVREFPPKSTSKRDIYLAGVQKGGIEARDWNVRTHEPIALA
jgi:hypothetical protein